MPASSESTVPTDIEAALRAELTATQAKLERATSEYEALRADSDTIQEDRDSAHQFVAEAQALVDAAERALARFEAGDYGRCERCGEPIAPERLEAIPDTVTCRACS
ncbi:MAG: TraR/DksA C4-type zinc finger protein [Ilumatobacteraceae bacterium]